MMRVRRTCKEVAALLVAQEDRQLAFSDSLVVRLHLLACQACPDFERQLLTMRNALKQWRQYTESGNDDGSNSR